MRIIGGELRGRGIASKPLPGLRPTTDRVRESLFNILSARIDFDGLNVLDLYAGTGALGLEALSRGGEKCVFVESHRQTAKLIKKNIRDLGLDDKASVVVGDVRRYRDGRTKYDIVFADPPYTMINYDHLFGFVLDHTFLSEGGWMVIEHASHVAIVPPEGIKTILSRAFGSIAITVLERDG